MRGLDDVKSWLAQDCTGSAETAAAPWWRLVLKYRPDARIVIVRRRVEDVVESFLRVYPCDREGLTQQMRRLDRKLDQIETRAPNVLSVRYDELSDEKTCATVFEHCLPYRHDPNWWHSLADVNVQISVPSMMRYAAHNMPQLEKLAKVATHEISINMMTRPIVEPAGITIAEDTFEAFERDGHKLFAEHCALVGESPDTWREKNWDMMRALYDAGSMQIMTARSNGRMFGYLMTVISPSLEFTDRPVSIDATFYAAKEIPGLGMKLQRAALAKLKERGVAEAFFRAGPRGSGPKMGTFYRRLGAQDDGLMFRLDLRG